MTRKKPNLPPPPIPKFDATTARRFLSLIMDPEAGVTELRVFKAGFEKGFIVPKDQYSATLAGWYDSIDDLIADLGKLNGVSGYITINPVRSDLLARCANRIGKQKHTTLDVDIVIFRWLYIDIDPRRPAEISATDDELAAAVEVRDRILSDHPDLAAHSIYGRSGNGAWILALLPDYLPEEGHDLAVRALAWVSQTYSNEAVKIDVATKNPSRVGVIPGTVKCKGSHIGDRPYRLATLDSPDRASDDPLMPVDLRRWLENIGATQTLPVTVAPPANGYADHRASGPNGTVKPAGPTPDDNRFARAYAYVFSPGFPASIAGEKGHGALYRCACELIDDFGLSREDALTILSEWNRTKASPPESDYQVAHKIDDAIKNHPVPRLRRLNEDRNGFANGNGHAPQADGVIPPAGDNKKQSPLIDIVTTEMIVNNEVSNLLHGYEGMYQRNYRLVEVAKQEKDQLRHRIGKLPAGTPTIVQIESPRLREIISVVASFRIGKKPAHPPDWCVSAILSRRNWPGVPDLAGIVEHPVLRSDGSMLEQPGYDPETGMLWVSNGPFEPIPEHPTHDDARQASDRLLAIVNEFPFQGKPHRAAWLACLLTVLNRHLIDDAVPLFLFEATVSGSGKTLLCDLIGRIVTGRDMIRSAYYHDAVEMDKQIVSTALGGIRVTMLDNVEGAFGNSSLDNALTARWYRGRILGHSTMSPPLLLDTTFIATGNNISFHGDIFRRVVPCRLESPYERPDKDKTTFKIEDIRSHVMENRDSLIRDALTITRAYLQANAPCSLPTNVYPHWTRIIRGMLAWTIGIDPLEGQRELAEADMSRMSRAGLLDGFVEMLRYLNKYEMTGGEVLAALQQAMYADRFDTIREAISSLWPKGKLEGLISSLGRKLMSMRGSRTGNFSLIKTGMYKHTAKWGVQYWEKNTCEWIAVTNWEEVKHLFDGEHLNTDKMSREESQEVYEVDQEATPF